MGAIMMIRDSIGIPALMAATGDVRLRAACRKAMLWVVDTLETWAARAEQRRQLATLDARMLRDIGRSESDALRESAKPFWMP